MLKVLILICAASLDHEACTPDTATDVIRASSVSNPAMCGGPIGGQGQLAGTALAPDSKQYIKIVCTRDKVVKATK